MRAPPINHARQLDSTRRKRAAGAAGSAGFAPHLASGAAPAAEEASSLTAASALAALLEVQEIDVDAHGRNRRAAGRYASAILDRLEALRVEVIGGRVSPARLADLVEALRAERPPSHDAGLDGLVDAIALRAEIEIAKFGIAS